MLQQGAERAKRSMSALFCSAHCSDFRHAGKREGLKLAGQAARIARTGEETRREREGSDERIGEGRP
jgi:hypothetical protein